MVWLIKLVLFYVSTSAAFSKFIHTGNALEDTEVYKQLHMVTSGKLFYFKYGAIYFY